MIAPSRGLAFLRPFFMVTYGRLFQTFSCCKILLNSVRMAFRCSWPRRTKCSASAMPSCSSAACSALYTGLAVLAASSRPSASAGSIPCTGGSGSAVRCCYTVYTAARTRCPARRRPLHRHGTARASAAGFPRGNSSAPSKWSF